MKKISLSRLKNRSIFTKVLNKLNLKKRPLYRELIITREFGFYDHHAGYQYIPNEHRNKLIMSVVRNPFEQLISQFEFGWWKKNSDDIYLPREKIDERFPHFPNLSLGEYIELKNWKDTFYYPNLNVDVGFMTLEFIQLLFKNPKQVIEHLSESYMNSLKFKNDMPEITFLKTESLNTDLYKFLLKASYFDSEVEFILDHKRINVTQHKSSNRQEFLTEEVIKKIMQSERFLFKILEFYGFHYSPNNLSS